MIDGSDGGFVGDDVDVGEFPDIESFVDGHSLRDKYRCSVFKYDMESGDWALVDNYAARAPKADEVAQMCGVGRFKWKFTFDDLDPVTRRRKKPLEYEMTLKGQKWEDLHEEYKQKRQVEKLAKHKAYLEKMRAENMLMGGALQHGDAEEKVLKQLTALKTLLPAAPVSADSNMLPLMMQMMKETGERSQTESRNMLTMMMNMQQQSTQLLLGLITSMNQNKAPAFDPMTMFNNITTMVQKTMELKQDMNPVEPDRLQTILEFAKEVLPAAFGMLARVPKAARPAVVGPIVKSNEHFQALKENPELLAGALNEWDKIYGPSMVDELLAAGGLTRPESTFGNYEKYQGGAAPSQGTEDADVVEVREDAAPSTGA